MAGPLFVAVMACYLAVSCSSEPTSPVATRPDLTAQDFETLLPGLQGDVHELAVEGRTRFNETWSDDRGATRRQGLGPTFNAVSCADCHAGGGASAPPTTPDDPIRGLILHVSGPGGTTPHPALGGQLQDRSVLGVEAEGTIGISYQRHTVLLSDTTVALDRPVYSVSGSPFARLDDLEISPRLAPPVAGTGLLEAVPDERLRELADPEDADGNGIRGTLGPSDSQGRPGRFGWKAEQTSLDTQIIRALHEDLGVTTSQAPAQNCPPVQATCLRHPSNSPEISDEDLRQLITYVRHLAPARAQPSGRAHASGQALFERIGCANCHTPSHTTSSDAPAPLAGQTIYPYTDLLLHDLGPGLADGDGTLERQRQWRTPPLWGIGLRGTNGRPAAYLHDGRANTILEAIVWHGGEAQPSVDLFGQLPPEEREELIEFVRSL